MLPHTIFALRNPVVLEVYAAEMDKSDRKGHSIMSGTSRQRSGKGAVRKKFPLQKLRWGKLN